MICLKGTAHRLSPRLLAPRAPPCTQGQGQNLPHDSQGPSESSSRCLPSPLLMVTPPPTACLRALARLPPPPPCLSLDVVLVVEKLTVRPHSSPCPSERSPAPLLPAGTSSRVCDPSARSHVGPWFLQVPCKLKISTKRKYLSPRCGGIPLRPWQRRLQFTLCSTRFCSHSGASGFSSAPGTVSSVTPESFWL